MSTTNHHLCQLLHRLLGAWLSVQVELQGKYSLDRMRQFHLYDSRASRLRILTWCILTPIPCLILNTVMDFVPLAKPSEGREANYVFWARYYVSVLFIIYGMYMQIGFLTPGLGMTQPRALGATFVVTTFCLGYIYIVAGFTSMPVPFLFLVGTPAFMLGTTVVFLALFGKLLRRDTPMRKLFFKANAVISSQLNLTLIYPVFIYGFNKLAPPYRNPYMILLPIIKIAAKNGISKLVGENDDLKPEVVIFNVEIFNALYVSLAMQNSTTISTSVMLFAIDFVQAWMSMMDVLREFRPLRKRLSGLPANHPLKGKSFLDAAIALVAHCDNNLDINRQHSKGKALINASTMLPDPTTSTSARNVLNIPFQNKVCTISSPIIDSETRTKTLNPASIVPLPSNTLRTTLRTSPAVHELLQSITSESDRSEIVRVARQLLFTIEFIVLIEYTEIIIPIFYSTPTHIEQPYD